MKNYITTSLLLFIWTTSYSQYSSVQLTDSTEVLQMNKDEKTLDPWNSWVFNFGEDYRLLLNRYSNLYGYNVGLSELGIHYLELISRIYASRVTDQARLSIWADVSYYKDLIEYTRLNYDVTIRTRLKYMMNFNEHLSFGAQTIFETEHINFNYGKPKLNTMAAFRPTVAYNFFPNTSSANTRLECSYSAGPHYVFDGATYEYTAFQNFELEFTQFFKRGSISLVGDLYQSFKRIKVVNYYLNPNVNVKIYNGLSFNIGSVFNYYDESVSTVAYVLKLTRIDFDDFGNHIGYDWSGYVGLNYRFGSNHSNDVNIRF